MLRVAFVLSGYLFMLFAAFEERPAFVLGMSLFSSMFVVSMASRHIEAGGTRAAGFIWRLFIISLALWWRKVCAFAAVLGSTI